MCDAVPGPVKVGGLSPLALVTSGAQVACPFDMSGCFGHVPNIFLTFGIVSLQNQDGTKVTSMTDQGLSVRLCPLSRWRCVSPQWLGLLCFWSEVSSLVFYLPSLWKTRDVRGLRRVLHLFKGR